MCERLKLVQLKAERADGQIRKLDSEIRSFLDKPAYVVSTKTEPETGNTVHYISQALDMPPDIAHLTGEVIHSLRSTLDHLAYQLFLKVRTDPSDEGTRIHFPIYNPSKEPEASAFGKVKILGDQAIEAIRACKPYKGANNLLWAIHKLDNIDKHRTLLTVGAAFQGIHIEKAIIKFVTNALGFKPMRPIPNIAMRLPRLRCPLNVGDKLFLGFPQDEEVNKELQFSFTVALSETGVIESKPIIDVLREMATLVNNIVGDFAPLLK